MILHGEYKSEFEDRCEELGMLMAASLTGHHLSLFRTKFPEILLVSKSLLE